MAFGLAQGVRLLLQLSVPEKEESYCAILYSGIQCGLLRTPQLSYGTADRFEASMKSWDLAVPAESNLVYPVVMTLARL